MRPLRRLIVASALFLAPSAASGQGGTPAAASPTGEAGIEAVRARIRQIRGEAAPSAPVVVLVGASAPGTGAMGATPTGAPVRGADGRDGRDAAPALPGVSPGSLLPGVVYIPPRAPASRDTVRVFEPASAPVPASSAADSVRARDAERALLDTGLFHAVGVNFAFGRAVLIDGADRVLDAVGAVLRRHPDLYVEVGGHTDAVGSEAANQRLSERRAAAVRAFLIERWGIAPERLTAAGYGEARPVSADPGETGRALNRRVEFAVMPR